MAMVEYWTIRVCKCGFPLGATLAAIQLKKCPDCGQPTIPAEDVTQSVDVTTALAESEIEAIGSATGDWLYRLEIRHEPGPDQKWLKDCNTALHSARVKLGIDDAD